MSRKSPNWLKPSLVCAAAVIVSIVVFFWLYADWGYGKLSPEGYRFATALYTVCNQKDEARLALFVTKFEEAKTYDKLRVDEQKWIERIIKHAQGGDWKTAAKRSRQLMEDQIER